MPKYIIYLLVVFIVACNVKGEGTPKQTNSSGNSYRTIEIDSCEYIEYDNGVFDQRVYAITHKGNCKYCIQRIKNQQQNKE